MKTKNILLTLLAVAMLLFTMSQAMALVVVDYGGFSYGSSTSTNSCIGMIIINNASYDIRLLQVNKTSNSGATDWFIYEGKEKEIGNATRCLTGMNASKLMARGKFSGTSGNVSAINNSLILQAGKKYTLVSDGNGSSVTFAYSADSYPMTGSSGKIIWEQGMDSNFFDEYKRVFTGITFAQPASFQDNFDRPDNATVGGVWNEITGADWKISNSTLFYELPASAGQDEIVMTQALATGTYDGFQITKLPASLLKDFQIYVKTLANDQTLTIRWNTANLTQSYNGSTFVTCNSNFAVKEGDWVFINKTGDHEVIIDRGGNATTLCSIGATTYNTSVVDVGVIYLSTTYSGTGGSFNFGSVCSANDMADCKESFCSTDADCGTCAFCNSGTCNNQNNAQDLKNDCSELASCNNSYTYSYTNGLCNGLGSCTSAVDNNVTSGNICINEILYDTNPTSGVNCAVWYDCVTNYTTANEYLTGYTGDGNPTCTATDWQYTGNNYTAPNGYGINQTNQGLNCSIYLLPECSVNADCGTCEWCNGTICQNQTSIQDLKNECTANYNCVNPYTYSDGTDFCNGAGSCASTQDYNVTQGNVCINTTSYDSDPQSAGNCAIYYDCITNMTTADEYYTGYTGDGNPTCTVFDWKLSGGSITAPNGSYINTTQQGLNCSIYTPPTPIVNGTFGYNQNDLAPSFMDAIGGFFAGLAKTALIIGILAGLALFVYLFTIGTEKLAPINRKK